MATQLHTAAPTRPPVAPAADAPISVRGLNAWYGESHVLHGVDIDLAEGECVTLLGRNGAGKSTTLKSIMGVLGARKGSIKIRGKETVGLSADKIARLGVAWCPEERAIFSSLSVEENLMLPPVLSPGGMTIEELFHLFPNLRARGSSQGTKLSGGEQQMLAMARILRTGARILLLDEITEGLAPVIVEQLAHMIVEIKKRGYTILLVEQNFRFTLGFADRHYVMDHGVIVDELTADEAINGSERLAKHLGV
ncbi:ABC transporter ATP-binding protein [Segnochrobactraceae bacterium EtOH-i3]